MVHKESKNQDIVTQVIEKEKTQMIQSIKESVFNYIKEHNGKCDLVDLACHFKECTIDIPGLATQELMDEGRVEYRAAMWNIQPYRLFARD